MRDFRGPGDRDEAADRGRPRLPSPGKGALTSRLLPSSASRAGDSLVHPLAIPVQLKATADGAGVVDDPFALHQLADHGVAGASGRLPHADRIGEAFGRHDVSDVRVAVGGPANDASEAMGARAYATGRSIAFASEPDLHLAAHEAAHVVQQRAGVQLAGGVGRDGDEHERHADAVADAVVRGDSAEALLDRYAASEGRGGVQRAVQRWSWRDGDRAARPVEARQQWDSTAIDSMDGGADTDGDAVVATAALRFTRDKVIALRHCLGLNPNHPRIDREFVAAVDARRGSPGVIDLDLVFALDPGTSGHLTGLGAARATYTTDPMWAAATPAEVTAIASAVAGPLRVDPTQLTPRSAGGATATVRFCRQVANWQLWHRRTVEAVAWGQLSAADLAELGATAPAGAPAATADAPAADRSVDETVDATAVEGAGERAPAAEAAPPAVVRDEQGFTTEERAELNGYLRDMRRRLRALRDARAGGAEAVAAAEQEVGQLYQTIRRRMIELERPNVDFSRPDQYRSVSARGNWMIAEIRSQLGETVEGHGASAGGGGSGGDGEAAEGPATGPTRVAPTAARTALRDAGLVNDEDADLEHRDFDGRVLHRRARDRASPEEVEAEIVRVDGNIDRAIADLERRIAALDAAQGEALRRLMLQLTGVTYEPIARLRHAPVPIRVPWDERDRAAIASEDETALRRRATRWTGRAGLAGQIAALRRLRASTDSYGTFIREARSERGGVLAGNDAAMEVDLNRTGVSILWGSGTPVPSSEMRLDPQFAEATMRFLHEMRGHGVTALWTAGFLRQVISPMDTHPEGKAVDITAFQFGDHVLHLRDGRPGTSAWFNHTDRVNGRTYEEVLHAITARMPSFFSRIVGPGNDAGHMGHWHCELTGRSESTPIHAIRDDADMPTDVTDRADATVPDWRTPD